MKIYYIAGLWETLSFSVSLDREVHHNDFEPIFPEKKIQLFSFSLLKQVVLKKKNERKKKQSKSPNSAILLTAHPHPWGYEWMNRGSAGWGGAQRRLYRSARDWRRVTRLAFDTLRSLGLGVRQRWAAARDPVSLGQSFGRAVSKPRCPSRSRPRGSLAVAPGRHGLALVQPLCGLAARPDPLGPGGMSSLSDILVYLQRDARPGHQAYRFRQVG